MLEFKCDAADILNLVLKLLLKTDIERSSPEYARLVSVKIELEKIQQPNLVVDETKYYLQYGGTRV